MAVLKCKMCGGDLVIQDGMTVCECEYCGSKQTVPNIDDEKKKNLFLRANRLRLSCEFDKASEAYETIAADFPEEAEAYWGLLLCRFGIEYVDDPGTGKKIPTCHRSSFDSIMDDQDFEMVMEFSDSISRAVYREEAKVIEGLRIGINEVSSKEDPYDIFICYKETDEMGERTIDSVIAQEIYDALDSKGYRVFFSRISLEDKLGEEYEPYIFAALNSAKVMLVIGTSYDHFQAVWVKNEWSRFLKLMKEDKDKHLIPCYKDVDAYDIPKEFRHLQAQDLGKIGAVQDLLRGVGKLIEKASNPNASTEDSNISVFSETNARSQAMLKRGWLALEDGEWDEASGFFDKALDYDPELANAYLGKLCSEKKTRYPETLPKRSLSSTYNNIFKKFVKFASDEEKEVIRKMEEHAAWQAEEYEARSKKIAAEIAEKEESANSRFKENAARLREFNSKLDDVISANRFGTVGINADGTVVLTYRRFYDENHISDWKEIISIATGFGFIIGLKADGTVIAAGEKEKLDCFSVGKWKKIVAVAACGDTAIGLRADGTVQGADYYGKIRDLITGWKNIVKIKQGDESTIFGIGADGSVVSTSNEWDISGWKNIVDVKQGWLVLAGLRSDRTVVVTVRKGRYIEPEKIAVDEWKDIVAIEVDINTVYGLKEDGTMVMTEKNDFKYYKSDNLTSWKNIVAISSADDYIGGVKSDGTVVLSDLTSKERMKFYRASKWRDIIAIRLWSTHIVGIKSDGTVVAEGHNQYGECNVDNLRLFSSMESFDASRNKMINKYKIKDLLVRKKRLQDELDNLNLPVLNLFTKNKKSRIEAKISDIDREVAELDKV